MKKYLEKNINHSEINSLDIIDMKTIKAKKDKILINKDISFYVQFNKIYEDKLLNKITINSSLNNLLFKYYNIPGILNYNEIKKYFLNFKIRTKKLIYSKQRNKATNNIFLFNKNYNNQMVINLPEFISIYGFR